MPNGPWCFEFPHRFNHNRLDFCSLYVLIDGMTNHSASWRMPTEKQMEKLAGEATRRATQASPQSGPADPLPEAYWDSVLRDPHGRIQGGVPIQQRRLSEIPRHLLRVSCRRCDRIEEIQRADAVGLYGNHAIWKDVGYKLLDSTCQTRTGSRDDDGCWPAFE